MEFSCCAFYEKCNYGRGNCYFEDTEPEKVYRCRCYKLKHFVPVEEDFLNNQAEENKQDETKKEGQVFDQLSLF